MASYGFAELLLPKGAGFHDVEKAANILQGLSDGKFQFLLDKSRMSGVPRLSLDDRREALGFWKKLAKLRGLAYQILFTLDDKAFPSGKAKLRELKDLRQELDDMLKKTAADFPSTVDIDAYERGEVKYVEMAKKRRAVKNAGRRARK